MVVELASLWLPIVVSAVAVFIASSIVWMVLPHHRSDYKELPDEDGMRDTLRRMAVPRGMYTVPHCNHGPEMKDPAFQAKVKEGPWAWMIVWDRWPNMGKALGTWIAYLLVVSLFVAYIGANALPAGSEFARVFQVTGAAAFMAYALSAVPEAIWKGFPWPFVIKEMIDGLVYALLTAGVFAWLWPNVEAALPAAAG
jgi:hypothetical protein